MKHPRTPVDPLQEMKARWQAARFELTERHVKPDDNPALPRLRTATRPTPPRSAEFRAAQDRMEKAGVITSKPGQWTVSEACGACHANQAFAERDVFCYTVDAFGWLWDEWLQSKASAEARAELVKAGKLNLVDGPNLAAFGIAPDSEDLAAIYVSPGWLAKSIPGRRTGPGKSMPAITGYTIVPLQAKVNDRAARAKVDAAEIPVRAWFLHSVHKAIQCFDADMISPAWLDLESWLTAKPTKGGRR